MKLRLRTFAFKYESYASNLVTLPYYLYLDNIGVS